MGSLNAARWNVKKCVASFGGSLIRSILREGQPPEYTARSVWVGLFVGFSPTIGIQVPIIFALWVVVRLADHRLSFNPLLASVWTVFTNVVTIAPIYYVYVQTGRIMLGRWENVRSYDVYLSRFEHTTDLPVGWVENLWWEASDALAEFGLPLFVGWVPWSLAIAFVGYWWSCRLIRRHRALRPEISDCSRIRAD